MIQFLQIKTSEEIAGKLNDEVKNAHNWLLANMLTVNIDKSKCMLIDSPQRLAGTDRQLKINMGGINVTGLGILSDEN